MANQFIFVDWLAMEALRVLTNDLVVAKYFNTDYIPDYNKEFAVGQTIRVPLPQRWIVTEGLAYNEQGINTQYTTCTINTPKGIHFQWNSFDEALKLQRGDDRIKRDFVDAPMAAIKQKIDSDAARFAVLNTNNIVGALGTNPTAMTTYNQARARLVENACPPGEQNQAMIISPNMQVAVGNTNSTIFNPQKTVSDIWRDGKLLDAAYGFGEWYESMSLVNTTADTWQGAVTVSGSGQSGSSLLVNCTSGDTFTAGNVVNIAATNNVNPQTRDSTGTLKQFVITQTLVASASTATISISPAIVGPGATPTDAQYQNVDALPLTTAALTLFPGTTSPNGKVGKNGLAINRNAFALVGVKLEAPNNGGGIMSKQYQDPNTGLAVRFVRAWDNIQSRWTNRYDVAYGFGALYPDNCAVRVLGQN